MKLNIGVKYKLLYWNIIQQLVGSLIYVEDQKKWKCALWFGKHQLIVQFREKELRFDMAEDNRPTIYIKYDILLTPEIV
jgi:hypothetical protein